MIEFGTAPRATPEANTQSSKVSPTKNQPIRDLTIADCLSKVKNDVARRGGRSPLFPVVRLKPRCHNRKPGTQLMLCVVDSRSPGSDQAPTARTWPAPERK